MNELLLFIEDTFRIKDRGYVATGNVSSGPIRVGDRVWVSTVLRSVRFEIVEIQSIAGRVEPAEQGERFFRCGGSWVAGVGIHSSIRGHGWRPAAGGES